VHWEGFSVRQTGNNWATHPTYCTDVVIKNLNIYGGRDGIDLDSCRKVRVEGCEINTGDDSISLKSGRGMDGARTGRPTEDVLITNCKMTGRRFACIGIGSEISAGVRNIRIEHCTFTAASHAIYLKTRIGRAGVNENISGDDLDVLGGSFLRLNLTVGGNTNTSDDPVPGLIGYPSAKNLSFSNVRLKSANAVVDATQTSPLKPIEGLTLTNITGTAKKGLALANITGAVLRGIDVKGIEGPLLTTVAVTGTGLEGAVPAAPKTPPP
jgi:polygalacturonase